MVEVLVNELFKRIYSDERVTPPTMKWKVVEVNDYLQVYKESVSDLTGFWEREGAKIRWASGWNSVVVGEPPSVHWFAGARLSAYYNVIGRHRGTWIWNKIAVIWEGEEGVAKAVTYEELDGLVTRVASSMVAMGVRPGDWILVYSPPIVEAVSAMLASVKLGAPFEPVFTGFGYWELARRVRNRSPRVIFVADGFYRRGRVIDTLSTLRQALELANYKGPVVVFERTGGASTRENEILFGDFVRGANNDVEDYIAESSHPLFGLHSGYRDDYKPITHPTGGFLVQVYSTSKWIGIRPRDTYFCTVWPGWITGISYVVFGPLMIGSTVLLYDGGPDYPSWDRWWSLVEDYAVTLFMTTSGALRLLSKSGDNWVRKHKLDTLRAILVTAEPLDVDTWWWTYRVVGTGHTPFIDSVPETLSGRIPVINMYIQSEIGTFVTGNLLNYTFPPIAPGSAGPPVPGFHVAMLRNGPEISSEGFGEIILLKPWPSMPVEYPGEYADKWRSGFYRTGDFGYMSKEGYLFVLGRIDGVMKVSGYRLSPGAIERALREVMGIESLVVPCLDEQRFEAPVVLYVTKASVVESDVKNTVKALVGAISEPRLAVQVEGAPLPKEKTSVLRSCSEKELLSSK